MKRIIALLVMVFVLTIGLVACARTEKAEDMKTKLKDGGYTVSEYKPEEFDVKYSSLGGIAKLDGIKTVLVAQKGEQGLFLFVFENGKQAEKAATPELLGTLASSAKDFGDEDQTSFVGYHNNVLWAGSLKARDAVGLNIK